MGGKLVLKSKEVVRALERAGFSVHHHNGSHARLIHASRPELRLTAPLTRKLDKETGSSGALNLSTTLSACSWVLIVGFSGAAKVEMANITLNATTMAFASCNHKYLSHQYTSVVCRL
jgi:predicted RNA binding protein YcfA (HicA-like mRNA interferase family)